MKPTLTLLTALLLAVGVLAGHAADPLSLPTNLRITDSSPAHLRIEWDDAAKSKTGYRIWRRAAGKTDQAWRLVGEVPGVRRHFDDGGLDPATRYEHRVTGFTGQPESAPSTAVASTTPALTPHLDSTIVVPLGEKFAHSPSAVADENGRVILAYVLGNATLRKNWRGSSIWLRVSQDGGRSWSEPHPVVTGGDAVAFAKPSLVRLPDGRAGMSYSQFTLDGEGRLPGSGNRTRLFRHSADHGRTWSAPVKAGDGSSNNDAIVLGDGNRLLEPLQTGHTRGSEPLSLIMASDDFGASWRLLSRAGAIPKAQPTGESDLAHLGGGRLILLSRHEAPFYCLNLSGDNGLTWDGPHTLWLGGGDNPPKLARIPGTETLVAVVHSYTDGTRKKDRRQLASVISTDGGRTWDNFRLIGFAPDGKDGFLQHAVVFQKDEALIFYADGDKGDTNQSRNLRLIRLHRDFFTSGTPWPYDWRGQPLANGAVRRDKSKDVPVFDVVVSGATAPVIVAAVRAAREGLEVALVSRGRHLGGSLPSRGAVETNYAGNRAPLLDEFVAAGQWKHAVQGYLAAVAFFDAMLGRLIEAFDRSPPRDNTIIVLWSDHGWHLGQKEHWSKFALWEQATRAPLLIVAPGVTKPNQRCPAPVSLLDIYPTLAELCGLPRPKDIEGTSLVPLLRDPAVPRAEPAVMTWGPNCHAVRDARWRYIRYADGAEGLYDHQNDAYEWTNLANRPEHAEIKARLAPWVPKTSKPLTTRTQWLPPSSVRLPADALALRAERADSKPPVSAIALSGKATLTLDDDQAAYTGAWTVSDKVPALLGKTYRHDGNDRAAIKTATFDFAAPASGEQSLRLLYQPSPNRSNRTTVTLRHGGKEIRAVINQRRDPEPLGPFTFQKGESVQIIISNEGADGHVVVDGLEVAPPGAFPAIPAAITKPPSSEPAAHSPRPPLTPERPRSSALDAVDGKSFDLVIFGGTPGGIAMAVRAAREGLEVLLVNYNDYLGGILSSGLRVWDTLYEGKRAPVYDEARQRTVDYYRDTYGKDSPQYRRCLPGKSGHTNGQFEPAVAEHVLTRMVNAEPRITLLTGFILDSARREGEMLQSDTFRALQGEQTVTVHGDIFADCSYEGDLAAAAKVPYRVGRESREEFGEPHAGVVYLARGQPETDTESRQSEAHQKLNLRPFRGWQKILPGSTGEADHHVQAFNYRAILTDDPGNRLPVIKPEGYDRDFIATLEKGDVVEIPNRKFGWNRSQIIGPQDDYVEGNWPTRQRVMDQHWQATLGTLYFLQNDQSVPASDRDYWRNLGLAADEFTDNDHRPYEIYAREASRIVGRYVFTQLDGSLPDDLDRASVHADSVGVTGLTKKRLDQTFWQKN